MSTKKELPKKYDHTGRTGDQKTDVLAIYNNARATAKASRDMNKKAADNAQKLATDDIQTKQALFEAYKAELKRKDISPERHDELLNLMGAVSEDISETRRETEAFAGDALDRVHDTDMGEMIVTSLVLIVSGLCAIFKIASFFKKQAA